MKYLLKLWRDFWINPWQARFTVPLILINLLGSAYGYYWYHEQLAETPFYFWPFVPDSPLSTTLFALALAFGRRGTGWSLFRLVAFTASIKYGLWAAVMISHFWWTSGVVGFTESMLWLSHLGMAVEGAVFLRSLLPAGGTILLTGSWMLLNDLMDYGLGLHPYLFAYGQEVLALTTALALTVLLTAGLLTGRRR